LNDFIERLKQIGSITRKSGKAANNSANDRQHLCCWRTSVESGEWLRYLFLSQLSYCTVSLWSILWLNTSSSTTSTLAVVCAVLGLPLPDFLIIHPVCFKRLKKSFNVLFFHPLAGNSFVSVTAS